MPVDRTHRRVAYEKLHTTNVILCTLEHEMHRVVHIHSGGLTPKELKYLKKRQEILNQARQDISKLNQRIFKHGIQGL